MPRLLFELIRAAGRLPPAVLLFLLWPPSVARAAIDVWLRDRRPPSRLPPLEGPRRGGRAALHDRLLYRLTPIVGFWADRSLGAGWASRYDLGELDRLRNLLAKRPVILASFHYGPLVMIPSLLNLHGMPCALAVDRAAWPLSRMRRWRLDLARVDGVPTAVPAEARSMLRFLRPGRCLMVALDYPTTEVATVDFGGGVVRVSTPPLRLARASGAAVVPVLARHDGLWRISFHIGRPVPDELLRGGDYQAAAQHICAEILPLAAAAPGQALPTMVEAFAAGPQSAELGAAAPVLADVSSA